MSELQANRYQNRYGSAGGDDAGAGEDRVTVDSLIADLASHDWRKRQNARGALVAMGRSAVAPLSNALTDPRGQVRWEAAKALATIGDPRAASALVTALEDGRAGVRWLAAEGLIAMRRDGLRAVLRALMHGADSVWLRQGAHHVLREFSRNGIEETTGPVLQALEKMEPELAVPHAAARALERLNAAA